MVGLFLWMGFQALQYNLYKYTSLGFSGEFCYYAEMATSLPDAILSEIYNFNPFGQNVFGYAGYEGTENFYQSVHFEPIKFIYALLYGLTGRFSALFLFLSLAYFSPLLYLALVVPLKDRSRQVMALLWAVIYALYPPVMEVASFDLRPRGLLGPALALLLITVLYRRPLWEKALALLFLFAVREEAILLAPFLILIDWLSTAPRKARRNSLAVLSAVWLLGTITALWFFEWGGFARSGKIAQVLAGNPGWAAAALVVGAGFLGWIVWIYRTRGSDPAVCRRLQLIAWLPILGLVGGGGLLAYFNAYETLSLAGLMKYLNAEFLYTARLSVLFAGLWGAVGLVWEGLRAKGRKITNYVFLGLVLLSAVGTVVISPRIKANFGKNIDRVLVPEHTAEVWDLRAQTDPYSTEVLWDYNTMTAFCDYEHSYGLERSPYFLVGDTDGLNYPENLETLKMLLTDQVEVIVIHRANQEIVEGLLAELSITPRKVQVSEYGGRYLIYWIQ